MVVLFRGDVKSNGVAAVVTKRINYTLLLVCVGVVAAVGAFAWAQQPDEVLLIEQPIDRDFYVAHRGEVYVRSKVDGDLVAAGRRVTVDGDVTGDVIVAAQNIEIRSGVGDDVRAAGQSIRVTAPISGHIVAAGQSIMISHPVGDWAWLAGDTVEVLGEVGGDVKIRAKRITINAEIAGDVELVGDELSLGPNTIVRGDLRWRSDTEAAVSPDAQIDGDFIAEPKPGLAEELSDGGTYSLPLKMLVAAMVFFLLFARPLRATAEGIATRPGRSLLLGFAVFFLTPVVIVLLLVTGVGIWLGLAVLFLFLVFLLLGVLTGLFAASDITLRRFRPQPAMWQSLAAIFVTVVVVSLLAKVPWLGIICIMAIWFIGLGALCWNSWVTLKWFRHHELQHS